MFLHRLPLLMLVVTLGLSAQESPEWTRRSFSEPPDRVFAAALQSITAQRYEILEKNDEKRTVRFKVGKSAFSWGYIMLLEVLPNENNASNVSIDIAGMRGPGSNGKVSVVAKGKKEAQKIFQGMDKLLAGEPRAKTPDTGIRQ